MWTSESKRNQCLRNKMMQSLQIQSSWNIVNCVFEKSCLISKHLSHNDIDVSEKTSIVRTHWYKTNIWQLVSFEINQIRNTNGYIYDLWSIQENENLFSAQISRTGFLENKLIMMRYREIILLLCWGFLGTLEHKSCSRFYNLKGMSSYLIRQISCILQYCM